MISSTRREALMSHGGIAIANLGPGHERDIVTGSHFGNFYHYHNRSERAVELAEQQLARTEGGQVLRSPLISATPIAYGNGLVVGGEGALFYLAFAGFSSEGLPRYARPVDVLEENALLYAGTLPVVNAADVNGDGKVDLVIGNSEGKIRLFLNRGSNTVPAFERGAPLEAGGEPIHTQQGYWGIQGPGEARWGYISPCVVDWNGDGLPDIVSSDATARHSLYLNRGKGLDVARPLYCDGLELHGTWRVRPGAAKMGTRMAYVALDDDDQFHLYWRIDNQNLRDAGKLKLDDGSPIGANFLSAGGTGRSKITLADWDGDGVVDLIVGTPRHGSVPNPKTGLPKALGLRGSSVLWLRNTGTNDAPVFAFPKLLHVRGEPLYLGQHECSAAVTELGGAKGGPNLIVGDEEGRVHFFRRENITWK
ncbi:MAG: VCBS repeat-containing protein [Verrucomicrobiota bacterium]